MVTDNCSGCATAPAIAGYTSLGVYGGFAYYISNATMSPAAAFTAAAALGGQVATIKSAAENSFVRTAATAAGYGVSYYIGINDLAVEGAFVGGSGEAISYFNWNGGEPNNSGNEDYVHVYTSGAWNDIGAGSTGNYILKKSCITPVLTAGLASGSAFPIGTTTVTYTATDLAGNSSNCSFTVTVSLNPASIGKTVTASPATICAGSSSNINIALSENGIRYQLRDAGYNNIGSPVFGTGGTISLPTGTLTSTTTFNILATNTVTGCNYPLTNTATVTVNPLPVVTAPSNVCVGSTATLSPTSGGTWVSSNASIATVTNAGVVTGVAIGTVTFTFTQTSTGCSRATASVTVSPLPNNVAASAASATVCSGSSTNIVIASSQSGVDYQLRNNSGNVLIGSPVAGTGGTINLPTGNLTATTTFNILATSTAGCTRQLTSLVTVSMDNIAPLITCPGNATVNLDVSCNAVMPDYTTMVTVSDNCTPAGSIVLVQSPAAGSALNTPGNITVTITATDASGNAANCNFTLTKADVTGPVISCPANITVNANPATCGAVVNYTVTATDNCSSFCAPVSIPGYTLLGTLNGHTYFRSNTSTNWTTANTNALALGAHLVTITSAAENSFLSTAGVSWTNMSDAATEGTWVWLNGEPVTYTNWNAGEPNNSGNEDYMHVNYSVAGGWNDIAGTGNYPAIIEFDCVSTSMTAGYESGSLFPVGTTTVSYTATDNSGNSSSCSFTVTVNDVTAPTIICPANIAVNANAGVCNAVVNYNLPMVLDNCSTCTTAAPITGYTVLGVYNGFAYYISNSTTTASAAFTAASASGGQVATINSAAENSFVRSAANTNGFTGNYIIGVNDVALEGTFVGGSGEAISYFNWNSGEPNNIGNEDYVQVYASGLWNDIGAGSSGNFILKKSCITPVLTAGLSSGSSFPLGTSTVSYSGTDAAGNSSSCSFTVTVSLNPASIGKTVTAVPATICAGSSSNINIALSENGIRYQLRDASYNNIGSPVNGTGGTISLPTGPLSSTTTFNILATNTVTGCNFPLTNTATVTVNALPTVSITGSASVCVGFTTTLSPTTGGTWVSSSNAIATVTNAGVATAVAAGTATFTFTQTSTGCAATTSAVTVNALPTVTAPSTVCAGSTATLSPTTGGTWASSNNAIATVTNAGVITGVAAGSVTFTFTQTSTGCSRTTSSVTVNALPTVSITGSAAICAGFTTTLSPTNNGTWVSSDNSIATVTNAGVVTGISGGIVTFTYTRTSTGCSATTSAVTVNALPVVTAPATVCIGSTATLSPTTGGTWTSSNNARATVTNAGVITGVAAGTVTFTFTQTSTGCTRTTATVTVNALPTVSVTGSSTICAGFTTTLSPTTGGTWASSDNSIATVTNAGVVTGVSGGTATFTFTQTSTGCSRTTTAVTINALPVVTAPATVCIGSTATLSPTTGGTWTSSNNTRATVTNAGVITGVSAGAVTFTFTQTSTGCAATTSVVNVTTASTISLTSAVGTNNQATCINTAITNITYSIGGGGTGATASGLPAGVTGIYTAGIFTISGSPLVNGTFNYTVTTTGACINNSANGTITISAATIAGTVNDAVICFGGSGTLNLTGNTGNVIRWESSADGGSTWTNIANSSTSLSYSGITTTTLYRALVQNSGCGLQLYSNNAKVAIHNLWTGAVSSDWNTPANWSDGQLPNASCPEVTIPVLTLPNVYPQVTSGTVSVNNLVIYPLSTLSVTNATLQVAGSITNNGTLDITNGTLELNGTVAAQSISGSTFLNNSIKNLIISNSNGVGLTGTNDTLKLTGRVGFGTSNAVLTTNGNLTIVSNAAGTGYVADLTNNGLNSGNDIIGNVTVERYIPGHPKAWQFLAVPTSGSTIREAWQENNSTLASNIHPGYGSIITSNISGAVGLGFDIYTPAGPSMKSYNSATNGWDGVANTSMPIANTKGYMFFVRGDRTVTTSAAPATAVTLRTSGQLYTKGSNAPATITVPAGKFESVGNPYASAIDFRKLTKSAAPDVADIFYVWDPLLTNTYNGLGGYQTISAANGWKPIPGGTTNYDASTPSPFIQSGQAFMVSSAGGTGTISFTESAKEEAQGSAYRPGDAPDVKQFFRASMANATGAMSDGNVVTFDDAYSNELDATDAVKIANSSENFGIKRFGKALALEARHTVQAEDTIYYNIGNMRAGNYTLKFAPVNMANTNLSALLVDKHLQTVTGISLADSTTITFSVTAAAAGSYAADRFMVIFKPAVVLPVTITKIEAVRNNKTTVTVSWNVETETNISRYEAERSYEGRNFATITEKTPVMNNGGNASYRIIDNQAAAGDNFYRIKAINADGRLQYSSIVKVAGTKTTSDITVYPNPVEGKRINMLFSNVAAGTYQAQIINTAGQTVHTAALKIAGNNAVYSIQLATTIAAGNYRLKLTASDGTVTVKQLIIL